MPDSSCCWYIAIVCCIFCVFYSVGEYICLVVCYLVFSEFSSHICVFLRLLCNPKFSFRYNFEFLFIRMFNLDVLYIVYFVNKFCK